MVEMFLLKQYEHKTGGLLSLIFMFSGIPPARLNVVLKWIYIINRILKDVTVFLFFFVLTHYFFGVSPPKVEPIPYVDIQADASQQDSYEFNAEF